MKIIEIANGQQRKVIITPAEKKELEKLTKKRYAFVWKAVTAATIYKLCIEGEACILGVMALVPIPEEKRIEIKLLACSKENVGKNKNYDGIAGCLIAFACRLCVRQYGPDACVSLVPKTELAQHYMQKYHMLHAGWQLYLEGGSLHQLLKEYLP